MQSKPGGLNIEQEVLNLLFVLARVDEVCFN